MQEIRQKESKQSKEKDKKANARRVDAFMFIEREHAYELFASSYLQDLSREPNSSLTIVC
jgi:hypothetical protein